MEKELPKNWILIKVVDVSEIVRGITYQKSDASTTKFDNSCLVLRGGNIQDGKIVIEDDCVYVSDSLIKKDQKLRKGDVIIVGSTGSAKLIGKAAFSLNDEEDISFGAFLVMLRPPKNIESRYFDYFFLTEYYRTEIRDLAGGININNIRREHLEGIDFPLPPLPEQQRIVAKLDTLFGHLDALKTRLERIPQLIKEFRQKVLTQAVTGKLTEEWREGRELEDAKILLKRIKVERENKIKRGKSFAENEQIKFSTKYDKHTFNIPDEKLPIGWKWTSILESCDKVVDCHNKTAPYTENGIYLLRTSNIRDGKIKYEDMRFVNQKTYEFWSKRCPPKPRDILFTREAPMGEIAIIPKNMKVCMGQRIMLFRTIENLLIPEFLLYSILSSNFQKRMFDEAVGSGVKHLRVGDVENLVYALPSTEEQQEIVRRVESLFAKADQIETGYQKLKAKVEQLPQALLAKAFRGELVPQLPTDGDARELLEEIKKAKAWKMKK